jgi:6-pyruvoyl-tetrahydropterin synthase
MVLHASRWQGFGPCRETLPKVTGVKAEVTESFTFEAAHRIECSRPEYSQVHGHSHTVLVTLEGEVTAPEGWLVEQSHFRNLAGFHIRRLDHKYLNEILELTTAEGIAGHLLFVIGRSDWPIGVKVKSVEVRKTTTRAKVYA